MSKRKRKIKSSLGHDPFEDMTDFEVEGPAPAVNRSKRGQAVPPVLPQPVKEAVVSNEEKPHAFAIADFFATLLANTTGQASQQKTAAQVAPEVTDPVVPVHEDEAVFEQTAAEDLADMASLETANPVADVDSSLTTAVLEPVPVNEAEIDELASPVAEQIDTEDEMLVPTAVLGPPHSFGEVEEGAEIDEQAQAETAESTGAINENDQGDTPPAATAAPLENEEDDIFPTEAELMGILDTAQLALTAEHRLAVLLAEENEEARTDVTNARLSQEPDLVFAWEEADSEDDQLPHWLIGTTTAEKIDTDALKPLASEDETSPGNPDLDLKWETDEQDGDDSLPDWLVAETSASKIDTDKLRPSKVGLAEEDEPTTVEKEDDLSIETKILQPLDATADETESKLIEAQEPSDEGPLEGDRVVDEGEAERNDTSIGLTAAKTDGIPHDDASELRDEPDWLVPVEVDETEELAEQEPFTAEVETAAEDNENDNMEIGWLTSTNEMPDHQLEPLQDEHFGNSLLNDWLMNNAYASDEDATDWLTKNLDDEERPEFAEEDEDEALPWADNLVDDAEGSGEDAAEDDERFDFSLDLSRFDALHAAADATPNSNEEAFDDSDLEPLPSWLVVESTGEQPPSWLEPEDSFLLLDEEEDELLTADTISAADAFANAIKADEFDFDFNFYEVSEDNPFTEPEPIEESELAFDAADFAFDALENKEAQPEELDLDSILQRFAKLPATQILSFTEPAEPTKTPAQQTDEEAFDFSFEELAGVESLDKTEHEQPIADESLDRLSTLPPTKVLQPHTKILESTFEATSEESRVLENVLKAIDAEMETTYRSRATSSSDQLLWGQETSPLYLTRSQFVVFKLHTDTFAISLDQVQGISQLPPTTQIHNVPTWVIGATKIGNQNLLVVNLRLFFQIRSQPKPNSERLLVVHDAEKKVQVGLVVDEVKGIRVVQAGEIQALVLKNKIHPAIQPYVYGRYDNVMALDINRLFSSPEMAHIGLKA